jgi:bifunctional non-homologous end joining protein LigD
MKQKTGAAGDAGRVAGVALSNPDRVLYPEQGITKLDLARFYETIGDWILPHVARRPLTLVRCPQGREKKCFYQKHLNEGLPAALHGIPISETGGQGVYVGVKDLAGVISLVQIGALEIHPWGSLADHVEKPDRLTFDLDPGPEVPWPWVIEAAQDVRGVLEDAGLESFVKTTGGKGLHVVVPLVRRSDWDEAKRFSKAVTDRVRELNPGRFVAVMTKAKRKGKIYLDYHRNGRGATAIAAYSTRARPGAPVSTPLRWEELSAKLGSDAFTIKNLPGRLANLKRDPWEGFFEARQSITKKGRSVVGL